MPTRSLLHHYRQLNGSTVELRRIKVVMNALKGMKTVLPYLSASPSLYVDALIQHSPPWATVPDIAFETAPAFEHAGVSVDVLAECYDKWLDSDKAKAHEEEPVSASEMMSFLCPAKLRVALDQAVGPGQTRSELIRTLLRQGLGVSTKREP